MKRIAALAAVLVLVLSTAAVALADDTTTPDDTGAELSAAQMRKAELIADYFADLYVEEAPSEGEDPCDEECALNGLTETIVMLRVGEPSIGWGAMYKLMQIAAAKGVTVDELLTEIPVGDDGEYEFGFGRLRKSLTGDELDVLGETPKNLGQLKKQSKGPKVNHGQEKKNNG